LNSFPFVGDGYRFFFYPGCWIIESGIDFVFRQSPSLDPFFLFTFFAKLAK